MILSRYLARRFLRMLLLITAVFVAILFLIDVIEQIRRFGDEGLGLGRVAFLAALNIAGSVYGILPLITLLAAIALFVALSRTSELIAMRAAGRSGLRIVAAPAVAAALAGVLAVMVLNPIVAATSKRYDAASANAGAGVGQAVSVGRGAVWMRQGTRGAADGARRDRSVGADDARRVVAQGGQIVIRAARASPDATALFDATFLIFDADLGPVRRIEARSARLGDGRWTLSGVKEWPLDAPNPERAARTGEQLTLPTELTAARIRDGFGAPQAVPVWQLPDFIAGLERAGFSGLRHRVWLMQELARPALMAAMVLLAAVFTMRPPRGRRTGVLVLGAFAAGVGLFFLRNLAQVMGEAGQVPAAAAAFAPPSAAALLALAALLRLEDG
ncbi:LPS export ABC transporter permease LptG [Paracoccus endophyticus]|uniref:LPS export ABC transporter permease LptG n=1 Tax=Paracoccus endophyticus TaxID=2233774 RepID=UPI000DDC1EDE|nr:LPS export ABC transporter permease LptG [Paracoccus endophyticus]